MTGLFVQLGVPTELGHIANALLDDMLRRARCFTATEEGSLLLWKLGPKHTDVRWHVEAIASKLERWRSAMAPAEGKGSSK